MELAFLAFGLFVFFVFNVPQFLSISWRELSFLLFFLTFCGLFDRFFEIFSYRHLKGNNNFFFLFWRSLRNELEKVGVKGYTKNDRPDLHMKSSISVLTFPVSSLWTIIRPQQIFCRSLNIRDVRCDLFLLIFLQPNDLGLFLGMFE